MVQCSYCGHKPHLQILINSPVKFHHDVISRISEAFTVLLFIYVVK